MGGIIETYIHTGSKLGIMVEVNCETDFVAKRPEFQELAKSVAMQIAACPTVEAVTEEDIPSDWKEKEFRIESASKDLQGKPEKNHRENRIRPCGESDESEAANGPAVHKRSQHVC